MCRDPAFVLEQYAIANIISDGGMFVCPRKVIT